MDPYYEDGSVTIYHGDALDVLPLVTPADALLTDPPYKLSQEYSAAPDPDNVIAVSSVWPIAARALRSVKLGAIGVIFYDTRILPLALAAFPDAGWKYLRALTLYRRWGQASVVAGWMTTSDFALVFQRPGAKATFYGDVFHDTFVKAKADPVSWDHPAQKPLEFVEQIIGRICPPGGVVLDPYCGSGTTLEAAKRADRRAIGIEIEERYCEIAAKRCAQEVLDLAAA